jgi:formate hydrogenlyase subunit 6/NADH:ubiquinone oxidoreductase subunit I
MLAIWRRRANDFDSGSRYPDDPSSPPPMFRGMPDLLVERCRGHAACAEACPSQALRVATQLSGWVWELDRASCVACGKCAEACPERAIVISRAFELAARTREALQVRVTFHRSVSEVAE